MKIDEKLYNRMFKILLKENKFTAQKLADKFGVSRPTIFRYLKRIENNAGDYQLMVTFGRPSRYKLVPR